MATKEAAEPAVIPVDAGQAVLFTEPAAGTPVVDASAVEPRAVRVVNGTDLGDAAAAVLVGGR